MQLAEHCGQLRRLVGFPVFLRCQAQAATVGAAAFVRTAETCGSGPGGGYQLRHRQARSQNLGLECGDVGVVDQGVVDCRNRVLPEQFFTGHFRAEVA
ncbi:hypothetical protein D3C78_1044140 [compost metagenome]